MKVIIPCAGRSSRFPGLRPKWMLTHPNGNLMVKQSIENINVSSKDVVITILEEHERKYDISRGLKENIGEDITVVILRKQTESESETVYETLKQLNLNESFLVKDSDNNFSIEEVDSDHNYVAVSDLQHYDEINPGNKSYVELNDQNIILDIVEKNVISRFFNVGGYFFKDPSDFMRSFEKLSDSNQADGELYVSNIIQDLIINDGKVFLAKMIENYTDWGTWEQWSKYRSRFKTFFVDIDGILFENGAQYFYPRWEDAKPIERNLEVIKKLSDDQFIQLIFVTARPEKYREMTEARLKEFNIKVDGLVMGCLHAKRIMINDFAGTTGYPSCESINILRNSEDLNKFI